MSPLYPASRMESTGVPGRIQISNTTAALLTSAGKTAWLKSRDDVVLAKGKGVLNTFWLNVIPSKGAFSACSSANDEESVHGIDYKTEGASELLTKAAPPESQERLVDWVAELLVDQLKRIVSTI